MKTKLIFILSLIAALTIGNIVLADSSKKTQQQDNVRTMAEQKLAELYKLQPKAKSAVQKAAGYAVFSNFGMKILVAGGGSGKGIAVNNKTRHETFMKMVEIQAGLGFGVKRFGLVWVFEKEKDLNGFVNSGWELGAQATATAELDNQGGGFAGAVSISPGVWLYQIVGDGLALELTAKGTKYYKDSDLN